MICREPMRSKKGTYTAKIQGTVTGYTAWAFEKLVASKRQKPADVARYIFDRWFDENPKYLSEFGISREAFERHMNGGAVIDLSARRSEK